MLRVGVVLESCTSNGWVAKVIQDIQSSQWARVELTVSSNSLSALGAARKINVHDHGNPYLFRRYERWDYQRNKAKHDALEPTHLAPLLAGVPSISLVPTRDTFSESQLALLRSFDLDVLLCFNATPPSLDLTKLARYGAWSFCFGDSDGADDSPSLFWQVFDRKPISKMTLQINAASIGRRIAFQGYSATDTTSLYRTRNPVFWKAAAATLRALRELDQRGTEYLHSLSYITIADSLSAYPRRTLNSVNMLYFMRRELSRWLSARFASLRSVPAPKWTIAIRRRNADRNFDDPSGYKLMLSPADRFYADPFLFEKSEKTYLFFEDFRYAEGRALISCCELAPDGTPGPCFEVLRRPYHLSYPFLFEDKGQIYMIPETRENRTVELYRATKFPITWVLEAVLLSDIYVVDATIQRINGKLWMFTGLSNGNYSNSDELGLFSAQTLKGPWMPHPRNPVISDVQRARPAGMLFHEAGRLIRPSQDCGMAYGYALVFSEILTLTETDYQERPISRVNPEVSGALSNHTYNRTELFEVVDRTFPANIANCRRVTRPVASDSCRKRDTVQNIMSISVVIPAYNASRFIAATLTSVLQQTLPADEILVIDDGSADDTAVIAERFGPPVHVIRRSNTGQGAARNFGVKQAASEWIAFLDADDLWEVNKLARQMEELALNPHADLCYTARIEFVEFGGGIQRGSIIPVPVPEGIRQALFRNTTFMPSATVLRRSVFLAAGGFDTQFSLVEDWDLWLRLLNHGVSFAACLEPLLLYRLHPGSTSHNAIPSLAAAKQIFRTRVLPNLPAHIRWLSHMRSQSGQEAAAAMVLRRVGDPRHLSMMATSILRYPLGNSHRYKILTHMLYTRLIQHFRKS